MVLTMVLIEEEKDKMAGLSIRRKTLNTNTHAVRGRLTSTRCREHHFRDESIYRDPNSNDIANLANLTNSHKLLQALTRSQTVQTNNFTTNSLVHSYMDNPEPLYSIKPLKCLISREWPFYLTISLLFILCLLTFCLINSFDYHVLFFLCTIFIVACLTYNILCHVVMHLDNFFVLGY